MSPQAETLDLTLCESDVEARKAVRETAKDWADHIVESSAEADQKAIRVLISEQLSNGLHGDDLVAHKIPLPDGSFLLSAFNRHGREHLPAECHAHVGKVLIRTLAGNENYSFTEAPDGFHCYLRIVPGEIPAI